MLLLVEKKASAKGLSASGVLEDQVANGPGS